MNRKTENTLLHHAHWYWSLLIAPFLAALTTPAIYLSPGVDFSIAYFLFFFLWLIPASLIARKIIKKYGQKFIWSYENKTLSSPFHNTRITDDEIEKIYLRIKIKQPFILIFFASKESSPADLSCRTTLILLLNKNRIIRLQLALLKNGLEIMDRLLTANKKKVREEPFNPKLFEGTFRPGKFYILQKYTNKKEKPR